MVGFSRLMEADEVGTLTRQKLHRAELIDPRIEAHGGKIIKLTGDGMIAEFPSVVEAVQCAVTLQREMDAREADEPEDRRIRYRIAVNLGDVIFDEGDVYGDGVNIAARLEALADPGGVLVSGSAYDQLKANIDVGYEDLGERQVKNIETPVRVYRVVPDGFGTVVRKQPTRGKLTVLAAVVVTALSIIVGAWWWSEGPEFTPADPSKMEFALPEKPSIAVLAFDNLSGDPDQEFLSDGLTEDIISALARIPEFFVIARNSAFTYKGKPVKVQQVAEELGVRYVLEGSVQRDGDKLRVTAQLIDAVGGHHIWSSKYDKELSDLFAVKDEITREVVSNLNAKIGLGPEIEKRASSINTLETWLLYQKAGWLYYKATKEDNLSSEDFYRRALEAEPNSPDLLAGMSWVHLRKDRFGWHDAASEPLVEAVEFAERAIESDPKHPRGYAALAMARQQQGSYEEAIELALKGSELAPADSTVHGLLGIFLQKNMQAEDAIVSFTHALRLNPHAHPWLTENLAEAYVMAGRYQEAIDMYLKTLERGASPFITAECRLGLAVAYDAMGRNDEARTEIVKAVEAFPNFTVSYLRDWNAYKDKDYAERWLATLKRLGLPEV